MFDNQYTKYEKASVFISEINAEEIVGKLEQDIKKHKMTAEKYAYLSKACIFMRDNKKAVKYAKAAIKADKHYAYGYIRLAFAYAKSGNKKETLRNCLIADELNQSNFLYDVFLSIFYNFCGNKDKADEILFELEKNNDESAPYLYNLGFLYCVNKSDYETAEIYLRKAYEKDYRDTYNLYTNLAECYSELRDIENAEIFVDKCLEIKKSEEMLGKKADCYAFKGELEPAAKILRNLYKTTTDKQAIIIKLARIYWRNDMPKKALRYYNFALKTTEPTATLYELIASVYEEENDFEKAIQIYEQSLMLENKDATVYASLSYCYSQSNDNEKAMECIEKALKLDNESSYIHYRKARVLAAMKKYHEAIDSFNDSLDYDETDLDCYQWISYCYSELKDFEKSLEYANRAIILDKEDAYSYFRKAWALQEMKKYKEAIEFYKECINHNDKYIDAYVNISYICSKTGDLKNSMLYANKAILLNKDYAYAHYRKAWALQETGKFEEAIDGYSKAIELDPTDIYNYLGIACVSLNTQANVNALLYANKALLIDRSCGGAYYYKSIALSNLGKTKEAEKAYAAAMQLGYSPV